MAPYSGESAQKDTFPLTLPYHVKDKKEVPNNWQAPFEILNKYGSQMKRLRSDGLIEPSQFKPVEREKKNGLSSESKGRSSRDQRLSAESIMRMAKSRVQYGLSLENERHFNLASLLLDAAEFFSLQHYDQAEELLTRVLSASQFDLPIERIVTCFARDLRGRISSIKGRTDPEGEATGDVDVEEALMNLKVAIRASEQQLAFSQITHFTGIQTILDSVSSAVKIHFIDIGIKLSSHWIILMHALANQINCPLKLLKITAVCTSKDKMEKTGKLLSSFAQSMNLPFEFKMIESEMNELKANMFDLESGEVLAVYLEFCLLCLSACPQNLEALIREIKNLNPYIMVINELEVDIVATTFIDRFHQALFLCSVEFDYLEACLGRDNECRKIIELVYYQEIIRNIVMAQGKENGYRQCLKIDHWREYFAEFGIVESELSQRSMYQASLLIRESACWSSCTLSMNGKCILLGWNGTALRSLSAWKIKNIVQKIEEDQQEK